MLIHQLKIFTSCRSFTHGINLASRCWQAANSESLCRCCIQSYWGGLRQWNLHLNLQWKGDALSQDHYGDSLPTLSWNSQTSMKTESLSCLILQCILLVEEAGHIALKSSLMLVAFWCRLNALTCLSISGGHLRDMHWRPTTPPGLPALLSLQLDSVGISRAWLYSFPSVFLKLISLELHDCRIDTSLDQQQQQQQLNNAMPFLR